MSHKHSVLVMLEQTRAGLIAPASLECLRAGRELADSLNVGLIAAVMGSDVRSIAEEARHFGVDGVLLADHPALGDYQPET